MHVSDVISRFQEVAEKCSQIGPLQIHSSRTRIEAVWRIAEVPTAIGKLVWPAPRITFAPWILSEVVGTRVLVGMAGSGKSVTAAHVVAERARREQHSRWCVASSVAPLGEWLPIWRELEHVDFLVIDGFGFEEPRSTKKLETLICARHDAARPTLICCGIGGESFRDRTDLRLRRRVAESGRYIACKWEPTK